MHHNTSTSTFGSNRKANSMVLPHEDSFETRPLSTNIDYTMLLSSVDQLYLAQLTEPKLRVLTSFHEQPSVQPDNSQSPKNERYETFFAGLDPNVPNVEKHMRQRYHFGVRCGAS
ncbi:hypothetical protein QCA50_008828 [Cerrena zonata]|uniref:Uncharacterized protein n=1 Tax=Cerrena zonata TaxID=2478898 RepID=A0AAW0G7K4_9APHY